MEHILEIVDEIKSKIDVESQKINDMSEEYNKAQFLVRKYDNIVKEHKRLEYILEGIQSLCTHEYEFDEYESREAWYKCKICKHQKVM